MTAVSLSLARSPRISRPTLAILLAVVAAAAWVVFRGTGTLPHDEEASAFKVLNTVRDWVADNRTANPVLEILVGAPREAIDTLVTVTLTVLHGVGWPAIVLLVGAFGLAAGGWRLALLAVTGMLSTGVLGLWDESIQTLGLTVAAVMLSLLVGIPLGILAGRSDRVQKVFGPILDLMQIMPTFAYLAPMTLFFLIGPASATVATMIYAVPAAIRITALGIRGVPATTVEATRSLGATRWQVLAKVQLPLARRMLALAVNQTIMMALGMVVVTALIDAPGLGKTIIKALERNDVGDAFDAGLAIVILAIVLDRLTEHAARRADPSRAARRGVAIVDRRLVVGGFVAAAVVALVGWFAIDLTSFPDAISFQFSGPINTVVDWIRVNAYTVTDAIKNVFTYGLLNPLEGVITQAPWWLAVAFVGAFSSLIGGWRTAAMTVGCLLGIAALGLWQHSMTTLATSIVATVITLALGIAIGIVTARSERTSAIVRPFLDAAQTMPSFVYLLPAVALFSASRFTAIVAAVIYAVPPVIRLVEAGIRAVPATVIEAGVASGASPSQLLWKVQLPMARRALLLAANQGIVMVLAMVVVGGLVGAGALGYDVVAGFAQHEDFGKGFAAGIAIVLLGVMLDRITQGAGGPRVSTVRPG